MADQGLWAVCGQAAGVIDMETAKKQTLLVEVMPLTGGHLALPKVRLSKYIPPAGNQKVEIPNDASKGKLKIVGVSATEGCGQSRSLPLNILVLLGVNSLTTVQWMFCFHGCFLMHGNIGFFFYIV